MRSLGCLIAAGTLLVAGCGGGESSGGGYGSAPKTKSSNPAGAAPAVGRTAQVTMENIAFSPARLTARVGQTVRWANQDGVPHDVTATKGASFKSKVLQPGQSYSYRVEQAGTIGYVCTIHPNMKATIQAVK